jgi:hypothetical protein
MYLTYCYIKHIIVCLILVVETLGLGRIQKYDREMRRNILF